MLTTGSESGDAKVRLAPAVDNSPVDTVVVVGQRLHQRRVVETLLTTPAAIVVVSVPTSVVWIVC